MPVAAGDGAEVALVGGEDVEALVSLGQHDARGVGQVEGRQVSVAGAKGARSGKILVSESFHFVGSFDLFQGRELCLATESPEDEVVQLSQNDRRDDEGIVSRLDSFEEELVVGLVAVKDRQ